MITKEEIAWWIRGQCPPDTTKHLGDEMKCLETWPVHDFETQAGEVIVIYAHVDRMAEKMAEWLNQLAWIRKRADNQPVGYKD